MKRKIQGKKRDRISDRTRRRLQIAVIAAGVLMMAVGIARGEVDTVFLKATNICLECIGIR